VWWGLTRTSRIGVTVGGIFCQLMSVSSWRIILTIYKKIRTSVVGSFEAGWIKVEVIQQSNYIRIYATTCTLL
jgi:hypothetical protein